jgi:uncharacterized protein (UPF0261 family)
MANFGTYESVPDRFRDRHLFRHNESITLMRTTPDECSAIGREIGERLNRATGPVTVFIPRGGLSMIDVPGQDFHDPEADAALFAALRETLDSGITAIESDADINDPAFAGAMADELHRLYART